MLYPPQTRNLPWPVVIVGAGAAGLLAAITAARAGAQVLLLETRRAPGAKIRASGGGRCNVLPSRVTLADFCTTGSSNTLRNILFSWPHDAVQRFFADDLGIALKTEATGKMFPASDDAREVVAALIEAAQAAGVTFAYGARVTRMSHMSHMWRLETEQGVVMAQNVIMAAGGLSLPKSGSDGAGWAMARELGHTLAPTYPALVPLCTGDTRWQALAGLSTPVRLQAVRAGRVVAEEGGPMLFTHRGFSGPAVLDISRWFTAPDASGTTLHVNWGDQNWGELCLQGRQASPSLALGSWLRQRLPKRLVETMGTIYGLDLTARLCDLTRAQRLQTVAALAQAPLSIAGSEGYRTAEVTGGGVLLSEVRVKTLESRIAPGLYLAGEMLDALGRLGGYNFLWAWVTGRRAGLATAAAVTGAARAMAS